jgi:hypothetical protein
MTLRTSNFRSEKEDYVADYFYYVEIGELFGVFESMDKALDSLRKEYGEFSIVPYEGDYEYKYYEVIFPVDFESEEERIGWVEWEDTDGGYWDDNLEDADVDMVGKIWAVKKNSLVEI